MRLDEPAHQMQDDLLGDGLQREGDVAMAVGERLARALAAARTYR